MRLWNGATGQTLILTSASKEDEEKYIDQIRNRAAQENLPAYTLLSSSSFYPDQTIFINPIPGPFDDLQRSMYQAADAQFRQRFDEKTGKRYPVIVSNIFPITTRDTTKGIIYVWMDGLAVSGSPAVSVHADIPYKPRTLTPQSEGSLSLDFYFPVTSTSSVPEAISALEQIVGSVESN